MPKRGTEIPIYPAREDTLLLRPFAEAPPGSWLLDIGTGNGLLALTAARRGARTVATDRNPRALQSVAEVARAERLTLLAVRTDLARGLGRFDRILANPPYLPTPWGGGEIDPWERLALDGGPDGCVVLERIVSELPEHLRSGGRAYLLVSSLQDPHHLAEIGRGWTADGGYLATVARRRLEGEELEVWELGRG
jgi:release factor glutamine methyltransferase